ncbi:MAG: hypothetical protein IID44_25840 [Planctomycetes bacterium]|nr:hypothetical protein [Planctomycetota bacterium]
MIRRILMLLAVATILMTGCEENGNENSRVAKVAVEAAERQAKQNEEMARLNRETAEGAKRLVEADAQARKELTEMQHDLQAEQAEVGEQRDQLEAERKQIAGQRRTESMLGPILKGCAAAAVIAVTIGYCWSLLFSLRRQDDAGQVLSELLVDELLSEKPVLLPPRSAKAIEHTALPEESQGPPRLPPVG